MFLLLVRNLTMVEAVVPAAVGVDHNVALAESVTEDF